MGKTKVSGMGMGKMGKITKPKVAGSKGLKIEGGFKAEGMKKAATKK